MLLNSTCNELTILQKYSEQQVQEILRLSEIPEICKRYILVASMSKKETKGSKLRLRLSMAIRELFMSCR